MEKISIKFECCTCLSIFTATYDKDKKETIKCPECGRKKLRIKKKRSISIPTDDENVKKMNKERIKEIEESKNKGEKIPTHERDPIHREDVNRIPTFQCVNCLRKFDWSDKKSDPSCSKCGSTDLIPLQPKVRFIAVPDPVILSKTQRKKIRFIRNGYRMYKQIEQGAEGLINLMTRCGISEKRLLLVKKQIRLALNELNKTQDQKLKEYDKKMKNEK